MQTTSCLWLGKGFLKITFSDPVETEINAKEVRQLLDENIDENSPGPKETL